MKINYTGDFLAPSGYGRSIRACLGGLVRVGVQVAGTGVRHDETQLKFVEDPFFGEGKPGDLAVILSDRARCPIKIWHETPEFYEPDPTQYNIAHLLWETDRIIDFNMHGNPRYNWVAQLNLMDEVWTPAGFEAKVFRDSGVTAPICVFPYPIDIDKYAPGPVDEQWSPDVGDLSGSMVFLSLFQWTKRKNPSDLLLAWSAEFGRQDDVVLVIKTYGANFNDPARIPTAIKALRKEFGIPNLAPNIGPITSLVHEDNMPNLYKMSDVFVLPSYGEGWGLPCQEAMACGKPVIYTDASALPEFCVGWPVKCDAEPVNGMRNIPWYNATQNWWKVRVNDLRRAMREAYNAWKDGSIDTYGAQARDLVVNKHNFEVVGTAMRQRLEAITTVLNDASGRASLAVGEHVWTE